MDISQKGIVIKQTDGVFKFSAGLSYTRVLHSLVLICIVFFTYEYFLLLKLQLALFIGACDTTKEKNIT